MSELSHPTPYAAINVVLHKFASRIHAILGSQFVGMYLYGSLALGDFNPLTSDIDFIVISHAEITDDLFTMLQVMHADFNQSSSLWSNKVEAVYIPQEALAYSVPTQAQYPQIEKGTQLFKAHLEPGWVFQRWTLRERGVVVVGPEPQLLIGPVSQAGMRQAVSVIAGEWLERACHDPSWLAWLRHREAQVFVVLTLCRLLYSLSTWTVTSKPSAANWARKTLDQRWVALIERTLASRTDEMEAPDSDVRDTLAFIQFTFEQSH